MVVWSTVSIAVLVLVRYAVLIAVVANQPCTWIFSHNSSPLWWTHAVLMQKSSNDLLPIAAVHSQVPVAHHSFNIVLEILGAIALVLVLRTHHVLAMAPSTMPVLPEAKKWSRRPTKTPNPPAVVLVGVVAIRQFRAIEGWLVRAAGWCCFTGLTCRTYHFSGL